MKGDGGSAMAAALISICNESIYLNFLMSSE